MEKNTFKWAWVAFGGALVCVGVGAAVHFTKVTGVLFILIGGIVCYMWYRKYAVKKPPTSAPKS